MWLGNQQQKFQDLTYQKKTFKFGLGLHNRFVLDCNIQNILPRIKSKREDDSQVVARIVSRITIFECQELIQAYPDRMELNI